MSKQWCSHLIVNPVHGYWYAPSNHPQSAMSQADTNWMHCPLCGTPRPSEPKRLEEKFLSQYTFHLEPRHAKELASIATKHFEEKLEGKEVEEALSITLKHQEYVLDKVPDGLGGYCTNWRYLAKQAIQFIKERILQ